MCKQLKFCITELDRIIEEKEIELMELNIIRACDSNGCNKCPIEEVCLSFIAPNDNYCNDWTNDAIRKAYKILKEE